MSLRFLWCAAVVLVLGATAELQAADRNWWPIVVEKNVDSPAPHAWTALGPLAFYQPAPDGSHVTGVRPFLIRYADANGNPERGAALYPLFHWSHYPDGLTWSLLNLVRWRSVDTPSGVGDVRHFEIWPFYFSRQTGDPATSYRAVFPLYGAVQNRFMQDRFQWVLFPLYGRFEKNDVVTTTVPWPFIKIIRGDGHRGFEFWPIAGRQGKPGVYRSEFALWPLLYRNVKQLENGETHHLAGFLPFYAVDRRPGYVSETFGWPFWGYVHRTEPYQYHARHYFWPFWVQGRGDNRYVNRWAPFYTRSILRDSDKRWIMWPLWRHHRWEEGPLDQERRQLLYFLYHSTEQRSRAAPHLPAARKTHVWPLWSYWDNGAGRRQVQALSPLEVFFPHNDHIRNAWSPLFAIYRFDRQTSGDVRHSVLWDAATYRRSPSGGTRSFQLGPLLDIERTPHFRRIALLNGLIGLQRTPERGWRFFFANRSPAASPAPASP